MQKLHRNLCNAVVEALYAIFNEEKHADKAIEYWLKSNPRWGARDRAFIAENTYEIVRWWRRLIILADLTYQDKKKYSYQQIWKVLGTWLVLQAYPLPDWEEFATLNPSKVKQNNKKKLLRKEREAIPDWLDALACQEMGEQQWEQELKASNQQANVVLRTNTLKTTPEELRSLLEKQGIAVAKIENAPAALLLKERQNIFKNKLFLEGYFEIQDAGSQMIAEFLQVKPSMRVIDACAGAGGKTLHLAALMQNKGKIIALDTEKWKLQELKSRSKRAGTSIIESKVIDSNKTIKRLENSADRLLLDVPCSGLGVLKRNPDAKWKLSLEFVEKIRKKQTEILSFYPKMLKKSGLMVYATCSLLPSENEKQIEYFLANNPDFRLIDQKHLLPSQYGFDGFYMALLEKI
ncbi:MAG: class I SAM-dependent methyltransferase [Raineya sp.]